MTDTRGAGGVDAQHGRAPHGPGRDRWAGLGHGLLDVPADAELEAILRVAAAVAGVTTATLNLLDGDRQCQLTTVGFTGADSSRHLSMCAVTVAEQQLQHVPDARRDPRFAANPWVTGELGDVVFYAAVPLTTRQGRTLGTLCVFDVREHVLDQDQLDRLQDCAQVVLGLFERQRMARCEKELADEAREQRELMALVHQELEQRHELTHTVLETVGVGIVVADADARLTMFNRSARDWHGLDPDPAVDVADLPVRYALFEADGTTPLPPGRIPLLRALRDGAVDGAEIVIAHEGREPRVVVCTGRRLTSGDGRSLGAVVVMDDVTARRRQEAALRSSQEQFRSAFLQAPNPIAVVSGAGHWLDVNPAFCAWLGWSHEELVGAPATDLVHPDDAEVRRAAVDSVLSGEVDSVRVDRRYRHRRGHHVWGRMSLGAVRGADGGQQLICQVEDVTEQLAVQQRLTTLALHDDLTGLANRSLLLERLDHALAVAARDGSLHAVLFCDLDHFKQVNDTHGHAVGDQVLVAVARRLQQSVRPSDTVARLGGDEFVVLCESVDAWAEVAGIVRRLRGVVSQPVATSAGPVQVGLSVGVARPRPGLDAASTLVAADRQMYQAKVRGRVPAGA